MIKPKYKVVVKKKEYIDGYEVQTRDMDVFKFLREFGIVEGDQYSRGFFPYDLYDPKDISDMLYTLVGDLNEPDLRPGDMELQKGLSFDNIRRRLKKDTIETMHIGQRGYTPGWAIEMRYKHNCQFECLRGQFEVTNSPSRTSDMPITRISHCEWEVEPSKSYYFKSMKLGVE